MKYRGIFEYEYPTEHKPPVSIDVQLHGDCVKGKIIEWEYRPLEQEPVLDKIRAETIEKYWDCDICKWKSGHYLIRGDISDILQIIDKYKAESEDKK